MREHLPRKHWATSMRRQFESFINTWFARRLTGEPG